MQDVEVTFCDLCGTSVPVVDLSAGTAVRHQNKVIGACCLAGLRGTATVATPTQAMGPSLGVHPLGGHAVSRPAEVRLLPVAVVMLAAIAAATIFLDNRLMTTETSRRADQGRQVEAQASDSNVLAAIALALDTVPRRTDLDALAARVEAVAAGATQARQDGQKQLEAIQTEVAALVQAHRQQAGKAVDYQPQFDDMRQRQLRLIDMVAALRLAAPAPAAAPAEPETPAATPADASAPPLPAALAEHVKKLQSPDAAIRFEAVDELLKAKDVGAVTFLLPLARDTDSFVRRLTVEGLAQWKRADVVDTLLSALNDADEYVRLAAWRALKDVTGQKIAFESTATKDARARAIQRWQEWWDKNKATFGS